MNLKETCGEDVNLIDLYEQRCPALDCFQQHNKTRDFKKCCKFLGKQNFNF